METAIAITFLSLMVLLAIQACHDSLQNAALTKRERTNLSQKAKKEGIAGKIKAQIMNGVAIDTRRENMETSISYQENETGYFLTKDAAYFQFDIYAHGQSNNSEVSPILAINLRGLPPAVIINAEFDILRDDGILYAAKLREAGVKVWEKCFPGQIHTLIGLLPGDKVLI